MSFPSGRVNRPRPHRRAATVARYLSGAGAVGERALGPVEVRRRGSRGRLDAVGAPALADDDANVRQGDVVELGDVLGAPVVAVLGRVGLEERDDLEDGLLGVGV